jgi:hypothetical protein
MLSTFNEEYYDEENTPFLDIVNQDRFLLGLELFPTFDDMLLWFAGDITITYEDPITHEEPVINVISHAEEEEETDEEETDEEETDEEHTPNLYYSG